MKKNSKVFYILISLLILVSLIGIIVLTNIEKKEPSLDPYTSVYNNEIGEITNYHNDKIIIYFFHNKEDKFYSDIQNKYSKYIEVVNYDISNQKNETILKEVKEHLKIEDTSTSFTVIGNKYFIGYDENIKKEIEDRVLECIKSVYSGYIDEDTVYKDIVSEITKEENEKLVLYLFYGKECPHCEDERKFLKDIEKKYKKYLDIKYYETWHDEDNAKLLVKVKDKFNINDKGVPFTVIGNDYFSGYSDSVAKKIESSIIKYIKVTYPDADINEELIIDRNTEEIPFLGSINVKNVSLVTISIILGFVDGFNPCAMWILLFLIGMLFHMKDKKRMYILGYAFLLTSSIFYFFIVFLIGNFIGIMTAKIIRYLIGVFAICAGAYNLYKYFNEPKDGCSTTNNTQRKKIMDRIRKFTSEKNLWLALIGVIILAVSVNIVELMCTAGFPSIFVSILEINNIVGFERIIYLLIYIIMYMIDDLVVFIISMATLEVTGISTKFNRLSHLVGGILMIVIGFLLLFKYSWLMFNF